ncbi:CinA family protein [Halorientalis litorea]|jgi:nicotinamide-nucleotide amidase|uniref:CinA family protein n=1 Tax=Halorientalis litorea TaxID=2931977 RepID=UPI001FF2AC3D|nr:CinA family protein [Halorientalis litorea]
MSQFRAESLPETKVGNVLERRDETLAVAESCTGGLVASLVTDVPGSSDYFDRSYVTYTAEAKRQVLGVTSEALDANGAVSEPVGRQMAQAARDIADTTWGLSTTGVAGPERDSADHPVGTVFIGVAHAGRENGTDVTAVEHYRFQGSRVEVKEHIARQALSMLLDRVEGRD